jgi:hypothetical protein
MPEPSYTRRYDRFVLSPVTRHLSLPFVCGPHFCSMRITADVRKFAAEQGITEEAAIEEGLKQKATEFTKTGSEIYAKT